MRQAWAIIAAVLVAAVSLGTRNEVRVNDAAITADTLPPLLSDYGFFDGSPDRPSRRLRPYTLITPLFSDYAIKARFVYQRRSARGVANGDGMLRLPVGSALIKTFSFRQPDGTMRTVETRVLLHRASGWVALPYIWRADGSDADLALAGRRMPVTLVDDAGATRTISYAVPNRNQCKTCHQRDEVVEPIGPMVRNTIIDGGSDIRILPDADFAIGNFLRMPRWDDPSEPLALRARAYLDVNCAHCHNPHGSASNSGLFLEYDRPGGMEMGLWKRPVAAGRGSGGMDYAIYPGRPAESFLLYRMRSLDPGIAMPEIGHSLVHDEGVSLIEAWIASMRLVNAPTGAAP